MSAEILAAISVAMLAIGVSAIIVVMIGLTYNMLREGWIVNSARVPATRPAVRSEQQTQPFRTAA